MSSIIQPFIIAFISLIINYVCVFRLPNIHLVKDPVSTLEIAVPLLLSGHILLLSFSLVLKKSFQVSIIGKSILSVIITTLGFHFLIVLFGASFLDKFYNTLLFASYLAVNTVMPAFESLAPTNGSPWIKIFLQHSPSNTTEIYAYTQVICVLIGSWIGAIVLPLDWERDWQVWPISSVISTFLGNFVGVTAGFVWSSLKSLFGKKKTE
ncbi:unnamed protein product [Cunninghamella blakesleeana]